MVEVLFVICVLTLLIVGFIALVRVIYKKLGKKKFFVCCAVVLAVLVLAVFFIFNLLNKCSIENCFNKPISGSDYCDEHKCAEHSCSNLRTHEYYCDEHNCAEHSCSNLRTHEYFCDEHYKCAICNNERFSQLLESGSYNNSDYCEEHTCDGLVACRNLVIEGTNYCEEHKCAVSGCAYGREPFYDESRYCEEHTCDEPACGNLVVEGTNYCEEHQPGQKETVDIQTPATETTTKTHNYSLSEDEKIVLWMEAKDAVEARLKSPSTAEFPFAYTSDGVTFNYDNSTGIATFWGWVDAENGYGATIRTNWMVDFYVEGGTYKVTNVEFF